MKGDLGELTEEDRAQIEEATAIVRRGYDSAACTERKSRLVNPFG